MQPRENMLRTIRFENPEYIPMTYVINDACWHHYDQNALSDLIEAHPFLFPDFERPGEGFVPNYQLNSIAAKPYTDPWGCVWETSDDGILGAVHSHPLAEWNDFAGYQAPDPNMTDGMFPVNWDELAARVQAEKAAGGFIRGGLPHGHTFLRIQDIRGYENLMFDMCDEKPELLDLIKLVEDFNSEVIRRWVELEPDMICFPEDLGMQIGPMLSPEHFVKYIKPSYQRMMSLAREKNIAVHMHSDGDIRTLVDDLVDGGVEVINLQDLVNGIDWIADKYAGRVCVELDVDRQFTTFSGSPREIDDLVWNEVQKLGSKHGGLMMIYGLYPGVPLENAAGMMDAMERYATCFS